MTTKLNPDKPDGGETRGTCDGYLRHAPHTEAEHKSNCLKPGLPRWEWKPLAPEAPTRESVICDMNKIKHPLHSHSDGDTGEDKYCVNPRVAPEATTTEPEGMCESYHWLAERKPHTKRGSCLNWKPSVAPEEAVGRETGEPYYEDLPIKSRLIEFCKQHCCMTMHPDDIVEFVQSELSNLRRERDQRDRQLENNAARLQQEFDRSRQLESQVRELTAQRDHWQKTYENLEKVAGELRINFENLQDIKGLQISKDRGEVWYWQGDGHDFPESLTCPVIMKAETVRELRAAVEKLTGELKLEKEKHHART